MSQTIAISAFAGMLARQSGYTADFCERFVAEMFKTVTDALKESNEITIKGLGKFCLDASGNVVYEPDSNFAADINAPFECFEPELLNDDVTEDYLSGEYNTESMCSDDLTDNEVTPSNTLVPDADSDLNVELEQAVYTDDLETSVENNSEPSINAGDKSEDVQNDSIDSCDKSSDCGEDNLLCQIESDNNYDTDNDIELEETVSMPSNRYKRVRTFISGIIIGAIIGACATYFIITSIQNPMSVSTNTATIEADDEIIAQPNTEESAVVPDSVILSESIDNDTLTSVYQDTIVYDYVTTTLAQLSRKHFGSYEFWVYIYEENRDIISNPDKIEPNMRVRIPSTQKYDINANDKASINKALQKSQEIFKQNKFNQ